MSGGRVLILGGASYAALNLSKEILKKGNYEIVGLTSKNIQKNGPINLLPFQKLSKIQGGEFDKIVILSTRLPHEIATDKDFEIVNDLIKSTLSLVKCPAERVMKILFASSYSVYDKGHRHINTKTAVQKDEPYARSKLEIEDYLRDLAKTQNISCVVARLPVFLYEGGTTNFLNKLCYLTKKGKKATMYNPDSFLSAVFDMSNFSKILFSETDIKEFQLVNCCSYPDITFKEIAELAISNGLADVSWEMSDEHSPIVDTASLEALGITAPSAASVVKKWFLNEMSSKNF